LGFDWAERVTVGATNNLEEIPVHVRAVSGQTRAVAWIRRRQLSVRQRLLEAGRFFVIGILVGGGFLFVPLVHIFAFIFALVMIGLGIARLRARAVLDSAGGVCPRCQQAGDFFVGLGRRRFRWPVEATCGHCGVELSLYQ